jgi:hypothetical protein
VEDTDWEYEHELASLEDDLRLIADRCRADETKKMVNAIEVGASPLVRCSLSGYLVCFRADQDVAKCKASPSRACRDRP